MIRNFIISLNFDILCVLTFIKMTNDKAVEESTVTTPFEVGTSNQSQYPDSLWSPYSSFFSISMGLLHLTAFVVSFLGNVLILSVKIFSKRGRATRKSSFLLLNLVMSDLLTSIFCLLPATVQVILTHFS